MISNYSIVYDNIANGDHPRIVTDLARYLQVNQYLTPGEYIRTLDDDDLAYLLDVGDDLFESLDNDLEPSENADCLILIGAMLAEAEACDMKLNELTVQQIVTALMSFLVVESLARKNLLIPVHSNMSFGYDMAAAVIAKKME